LKTGHLLHGILCRRAALVLSLLELRNGIVQALGDVQKTNYCATVVHDGQVTEVILDHGTESVHRRVRHCNASRISCHYLGDTGGRWIQMFGDHAARHISIGDDAGEASIQTGHQGSIATLVGKHLRYRQDTVIDGSNHGLLGTELRYRTLVASFLDRGQSRLIIFWNLSHGRK